MAILCGSNDHIKWPSCCLSWRQTMSIVGAACKVSPNWSQETMTCHSSICFSIVWGQGNAPLVTSFLSSCYMTPKNSATYFDTHFFFPGIPRGCPSAQGLTPSTYKFSNLSSIHFLKEYLLERI